MTGGGDGDGDGDGHVAVLRGVEVRIGGNPILHGIDLDVAAGDHHVVLGPNGSGKTTLLRVLSGYRYPTAGEVTVLGARFGRTDLRVLRRRIGIASTALSDLLAVTHPAGAIVAAGVDGATWPSPRHHDDPDLRARAERALERVGAGHLVDRACRTLSQGELQRVVIGRALVTEPELLLLDEPLVGLDVGGRESLLADLAALMREPDGPTLLLVTHHLEEVPPGIRSGLLLRDGTVSAHGPAAAVLTDGPLSVAFGVPLRITEHDGRRWARLAG